VIAEFQAMEIRTLTEGLGFPDGPMAPADGSVLMTTNICFGGPDLKTAFVTCHGPRGSLLSTGRSPD
jgi:hypothetical protein